MSAAVERVAADNRTVLGFWIYLMTDCILFASLFAMYAVLRGNTNGGAGGRELFDMPYALAETIILLTSSFACGMMMVALQSQRKQAVQLWLVVTLLLGASFVGLELHEFQHLVTTGDSWRRSGFLSSYFVLVGTHGLHITVGLLWGVVLMWQLISRGFKGNITKRLTLFSMFWHFLDVIWIFIFSIVYLWGHVL